MKIAIAVNLSLESRYAVRWGLDLRDALREQGQTVETTVISIAPPTWYSTDRSQKTTNDPGIYHGVTHEIRQFLEDVDFYVDDVEIHVDEGRPAELIANFCEKRNTDWLVTGMSAQGPVGRFMWGSTVHLLADLVSCNLAVVHPEHSRLKKGGNLIVGVDFSPGSDNALLTATALADVSGTRLHAIHALRESQASAFQPGISTHLSPHDVPHMTAQARHSLESIIDELKKGHPKLEYSTQVYSGTPEKVLAKCSEEIDADALVLGKIRRSHFEEWILGSTAKSVLKHMPTTAIFVPNDI